MPLQRPWFMTKCTRSTAQRAFRAHMRAPCYADSEHPRECDRRRPILLIPLYLLLPRACLPICCSRRLPPPFPPAGTDEHAWMRAIMAGKESKIASSNDCSAYWAAASLNLDEKQLDGRLDANLLMPCLADLRRGVMAGFCCRAKLVRVIVGDGAWLESGVPASRSLSSSTEMMAPVREYVHERLLCSALTDSAPLNMLLLVKVFPLAGKSGDQPPASGSGTARGPPGSPTQSFKLRFLSPSLLDRRGLREGEKIKRLREHFELPDDYTNQRMVSRPWSECGAQEHILLTNSWRHRVYSSVGLTASREQHLPPPRSPATFPRSSASSYHAPHPSLHAPFAGSTLVCVCVLVDAFANLPTRSLVHTLHRTSSAVHLALTSYILHPIPPSSAHSALRPRTQSLDTSRRSPSDLTFSMIESSPRKLAAIAPKPSLPRRRRLTSRIAAARPSGVQWARSRVPQARCLASAGGRIEQARAVEEVRAARASASGTAESALGRATGRACETAERASSRRAWVARR